MRLHRLELQAFGPFATREVIDFDHLASSGIFLLEGPTGAGKSTVLDAITFALFGGLASGSSKDRLHSDFAAEGAEPRVLLEFSVGGVRWRLTRVPEHERRKKRGEGYTTEASSVHLERETAGDWESVSSNKAEVDDIIADVLRLTRDQFTQVVLLPQGEFARFLKSDDDDRRAVLTKLFGTKLYDRVTAELDRLRAEATRKRDAAEREIELAVSAAAEAAGLDDARRDELICLDEEERARQLEQTGTQLASAAEDATVELEKAAREVGQAKEKHDAAARHAELMIRRVESLAKLDSHRASQPTHDETVSRLGAARRAEPMRPVLAALEESEARLASKRETLSHSTSEPTEEMLQGRGAEALRVLAAAGESEASGLQHLVESELDLPEKATAIAELEVAALETRERASELRLRMAALPEVLTELRRSIDQARVEAASLEDSRARLQALRTQRAAATKLEQLAGVIAAKQEAVAAATDDHQGCVDSYQRMVELRLTGMAAELAANLEQGAPCPVCGATSHPAKATYVGEVVTAAEEKAARRQRDAAEERRRAAEGELAHIQKGLATLAAVAGGRAASVIAEEEAASSEDVSQREAAHERLPALEAQLEACVQEQARIGKEELEAVAREASAAEHLQAAMKELAELKEKLANAAEGHSSVSARQKALRQQAARHSAVASAVEAISVALSEVSAARVRAEHELGEGGFSTMADAQRALLDRKSMAALDEQVSAWRETLAALTAKAEADELVGLDPSTAGDVKALSLLAAEALNVAQEQYELARLKAEDAKARLSRFVARIEDVKAAEAAFASLVDRTQAVIWLAGLAKGVDGHRKMALTSYVLRQWFEQVVAAANARLGAISSGRYQLMRVDEAERRRDRVGLTLKVTDRYTGEDRSPESLSGGETFYTSLALALGLVDVVKAEAGGVELDTLFIDEGFGSLDGETLDQVMLVIDELRDRGRVVGIVSHVTELKERIPERLEVRRLPDGSSTTRVVA